jgi:hypothetical protein
VSASRFRPSRKQAELCQITRKVRASASCVALSVMLSLLIESVQSISLGENESAFLERFGAEAEATLRPIETSDLAATSSWARRGQPGMGQCPTVMRLLERRIFMLKNTLWNPKSDAFDPKACKLRQIRTFLWRPPNIDVLCFAVSFLVEFEDAQRLPHEYEMAAVCRACHLIYQTIDDERFNRSRETATAAARRSSELFRSRFLESERAAIAALHKPSSSDNGQIREAWEVEESVG